MVGDIWAWLEQVPDPELPMLSILDLGIVREVREQDGEVVVAVTPTYSGCPATAVIRRDIESALRRHGVEHVRVENRLSPPWSTAWLSQKGRAALHSIGVAPPLVALAARIPCPRCGAADTECLSQFGSTPCQALYRCRACREPFDYFKPHLQPSS